MNRGDGLALLPGTGCSETANAVSGSTESVDFDTGIFDWPVSGYFDFLDVVGNV